MLLPTSLFFKAGLLESAEYFRSQFFAKYLHTVMPEANKVRI